MSLPDADKMIADLPGALRVQILDAAGRWHPAALTRTQTSPQATDYGVEYSGTADSVFVAKPFIVPASERLTILGEDGAKRTRRVFSVSDNVVFLEIFLGEDAVPV